MIPPRSFVTLLGTKCEGLSLPQVLFTDPDWFFYWHGRGWWNGILDHEASFLAPRAKAIRVPSRCAPYAAVEYLLDHRSRKFAGLQLVEAPSPDDALVSSSFVRKVIDLSVSHRVSSYDKTGAKTLVRDAKEILFGQSSFRMTKDRAASFFLDDRNFRLA